MVHRQAPSCMTGVLGVHKGKDGRQPARPRKWKAVLDHMRTGFVNALARRQCWAPGAAAHAAVLVAGIVNDTKPDVVFKELTYYNVCQREAGLRARSASHNSVD